jgi:hypothetical protein
LEEIMSVWHNNLDSVYGRKPQPLGVALTVYIGDSADDRGGQLETIKSELTAVGRVIEAIAAVLTPAQQATIAQQLGLKPGSNAE